MTVGFNLYRALPRTRRRSPRFGDFDLTMPFMTIGGDHSVGDHLAAAMRPHAPTLESVIAGECGHFVAEEVPDFFCDQVARFLAA